MKHKLILLGAVASLSAFAASQSSARHNGWYVGLEAGANWVDDTDVIFSNSHAPVLRELVIYNPFNDTKLDFDTGWAALGTVGYAFGNGWRVEGELGYRQNDFDLSIDRGFCGETVLTALVIAPPRCGSTLGGDLTEYTVMVNVLYDVPLTEKLDLNLGVGAGVDFAELEIPGVANDDDANFAFQAIAGLSYAISKRLDLTLTYRYLHVDAPEFSGVIGGPSEVAYRLDDLEKHTVTIGLRFDLHEDEAPLPPAPPPPPPMPPAAPEQFIIYFAFDKCSITQEADKVLEEAAAAAKSGKTTRVSIVGHTDTSGSTAYNQRLSDCRADAAKSNLVSKGVDKDSITSSGRGESELLVKTGDGVKEPQNRRATIDLN